MRIPLILLATLFTATAATAQPIVSDDLKAIQDNSFLIEEAYNQTPGVVQHITVFERDRDSGGWELGFTQEWPWLSERHQLSYSIPFEGGNGENGVGNVAVHYRYQLVGDGDADLAIAPRFSLLLPTSSNERDHGLEVALPISRILTPRVAAHTNIVASWTQDQDLGFHLAQSAVYAFSGRVHFLLEATYDRANEGDDALFVSPGVRWAYNFKSGLQVAPGVAFPIGLGPSSEEQHVLLYLSFEHPFKR
jgi:hypothetical protein